MCGIGVPIRSNLQIIAIGDQEVGEACFNCAQQLKSAVEAKKTEVMQAFAAQAKEQEPAREPAKADPKPKGQPLPGQRRVPEKKEGDKNA